jgi:hypothetical protein
MLNRMEEAEANQKILDIFWEKALISMK